MRKLYRSAYDRRISGICGGIAEYLGIDASVVRIIWIIATLLGGSGILLYIICLFIVPENPGYSSNDDTPKQQ